MEGNYGMEGMASSPRSFSDKSLWTPDSLLEPQVPEF